MNIIEQAKLELKVHQLRREIDEIKGYRDRLAVYANLPAGSPVGELCRRNIKDSSNRLVFLQMELNAVESKLDAANPRN